MKHRKFWAILLSAMLALQLCLLPAAAEEGLDLGEDLGAADWTELTEAMPIPRDISAWVDVKTTLTLNNKPVNITDNMVVNNGAQFEYRFEFDLQKEGDTPLAERKLNTGDSFSALVLTAPGIRFGTGGTASGISDSLNMTITKDDGTMVSAVVGQWTLAYRDAASNELYLTVTFNEEVTDCVVSSISGYVFNAGVFKNESEEDVTGPFILGDTQGTITIRKPGGNTDKPKPEGDTGIWEPENPPLRDVDMRFGKGRHYTLDHAAKNPAIQWRMVYLEQLQELQKKCLNKGTDTDFTFEEYDSYCIVEDILDANQRFMIENEPGFKYNDRYHDGTPFYFELPLMIPGTREFLNGEFGLNVGTGTGTGGYEGNGELFTCMQGSKFHYSESEEFVRANPFYWTIVDEENRLVVNIGKLGTTDSNQGLTLYDEHVIGLRAGYGTDWQTTITATLDKEIEKCQKKIDGLDSPLALLDAQATELNMAQDYETWKTNRTDGYRHTVTEEEISMLRALGENFTGAEAEHFLLLVSKLAENQKTYLDGYAEHIQKWETAKAKYEAALAFYTDPNFQGRVYGFVMKYRTSITNTATKTVSNRAKLTLEEKEQETTSDKGWGVTIYGSGAVGNYLPGTVVVQKIDSETRAALSGAEFMLYKAEDAEAKTPMLFRLDDGTYVPDPNGAPELAVNDQGVLLIFGLPTGSYYLVETKAPAGYQKLEERIEVKCSVAHVTNFAIPNERIPVNGTVTLTKTDDSTPPVALQGVAFELQVKTGDTWEVYEVYGTYTTDAEGKIVVEHLPAGDYRFVETAPLDGYGFIEGRNTWEFSITEDATEVTIEAKNAKLPTTDPAEPPKEPETGEPDPEPKPDPEPPFPILPPDPPKPKPEPEEPEVEEPDPEPEETEEPETETPGEETPETPAPVDPTDPEFDLNDPNSPTGSMEGRDPSDPEFDLNDPNAPTGSMEGEWGKLPQTGWRQTAVAAAALSGVALLAGGLLLYLRRRRRQ